MSLLKTKNTSVDLCRNCLNVFNCSLKSNPFENVTQCEEHTSIEDLELPDEIISETQNLPQTYQGLCSNCDHFNDCTLKDKQTIVLSCEQYS